MSRAFPPAKPSNYAKISNDVRALHSDDEARLKACDSMCESYCCCYCDVVCMCG